MIDFPSAGLVVGQLFTATNGVTYRWDGTIWITQAGPGGGTGDFSAYNSAAILLNGAAFATLVPNSIRSGNAGGWYSTSTGRYTPPAGRFFIVFTANGIPLASAGTLQLVMLKNGAQIAAANDTTTTGAWSSCTLNVVADSNGTDYFEVQALMTASSTTNAANTVTFSAFPLTGMQGPTGAPGAAGQSILLSYSGATFALTNVSSPLGWDTINENTTGGSYSAPNFTVPTGMGGLWDVNIQVQGNNAAANIIMAAQLFVNGAQIANTSTFCGGSLTGAAVLNGKFRLAAGDTVRVQANQSATSGTAYGTSGGVRSSWFHLTRVGA